VLYALFVLIRVTSKDKDNIVLLSVVSLVLIILISILINAELSGRVPAFHGRLEIG